MVASGMVLTEAEKDRLGTLVADWDLFISKVRQGRGAMVCIYLELKDVDGGDEPNDTMEIKGHQLFSNGVRVSPVNVRRTIRIASPFVTDLRNFLYEYSLTLGDREPIRCLFSGYGARPVRNNPDKVKYDRNEIICKVVPPTNIKKRVKVSNGPKLEGYGHDGPHHLNDVSDSQHGKNDHVEGQVQGHQQSSLSEDEDSQSDRYWFLRLNEVMMTQTQLPQDVLPVDSTSPPTSEFLAKESSSHSQTDSQAVHRHANQIIKDEPIDSLPPSQGGRTDVEHLSFSSVSKYSNQIPPSKDEVQIKNEGLASPKRTRRQRKSTVDHDPGAKDDGKMDPDDCVLNRNADQASQESWFVTPKKDKSSSHEDVLLEDPTQMNASRANYQEVAHHFAPSATKKRSHSTSVMMIESEEPSPRTETESKRSRSAASISDKPAARIDLVLSGIETQALLEEAEAESSHTVSADRAPQPVPSAISSSSSSGRPITPIRSTKFNQYYNFLAVLLSAAEPRPTIGGSAAFSQQIAVADSTGWLKVMLFAASPSGLMPDVNPGAVLILQGIQIKHWVGSTEDGKQGVGNEGMWSWTGLVPARGLSAPTSASVIGNNEPHLTEGEFRHLCALSDWYHHGPGREELARRFPKAKLRTLKRLCDLSGETEYFDMLAEIVAIYPPENGTSADGPGAQPADIFVTDYTSHAETRATFDQHLGYEETEYEPRLEDGPGGGMVFRIALWGKQLVALHGMHVGQYVHIQNIRSKWNADYGISGAVGSPDDLTLKVRDAGDHPYLDQLIERKNCWKKEREVVLANRRAEEEENELAWHEAHASAESRGKPAEDLHKSHRASVEEETNGAVQQSTGSEDDAGEHRSPKFESKSFVDEQDSASDDELESEQGEQQSQFPNANDQASHITTKRPDAPNDIRPASLEEQEQGQMSFLASKGDGSTSRSPSVSTSRPRDTQHCSPALPNRLRLELTPSALSRPLSRVQDLHSLTPDSTKPGRQGAIYARVRAEVIDVMPRDPSAWLRSTSSLSGTGPRFTFALLLREEGVAESTAAAEDYCLPLIVADQAAQSFLELESGGVGMDLIEKVKKRVEDLIGWKLPDGKEGLTEEEVTEPPAGQRSIHEWGVAVWIGKKGRKMNSVWGCKIVE